mmetsp:Transcript_102183/g.295631  ORF Transcript_102183/g.295631 Transcript_102183/m.295631 type:complete len:220 (+) Transcript_102183:531-1190(+)
MRREERVPTAGGLLPMTTFGVDLLEPFQLPSALRGGVPRCPHPADVRAKVHALRGVDDEPYAVERPVPQLAGDGEAAAAGGLGDEGGAPPLARATLAVVHHHDHGLNLAGGLCHAAVEALPGILQAHHDVAAAFQIELQLEDGVRMHRLRGDLVAGPRFAHEEVVEGRLGQLQQLATDDLVVLDAVVASERLAVARHLPQEGHRMRTSGVCPVASNARV